KPDSRTKTLLRPPPRSSVPRIPHRDGVVPVFDGTRNRPSLLAPTLLTYSTPLSITPYKVTDWAKADAGKIAAARNTDFQFFNLSHSFEFIFALAISCNRRFVFVQP